ncbi:N-acetylglucosaminyl deacetylase, LmbE family [Paracoccus isoporae]|uniref:N-acetylglucosaminyl deacetylase, LmbE family n=1 Tax=Paracoccus isoporae TaxID=591205 RepID=A0A1G7G425_9RHOB|nr:PIG-L deacetylase family protein [Paracoccus isoporae]SDE82769.1 N-acetylglucosaminyl deacetylase, LmbE family [Paracoccus isoporae]
MNVAHRPLLPDVFEGRESLVVLAPHPDDESLGCGALLARGFAGAGAHVICLTDGSASHPGSCQWTPRRLARQRRAEMVAAIECLGGSARDLTWLGMADSRLYQADATEVAARLEQIIEGHGARHVFVPAAEDHHEDHQATARFAGALRRRRPEWAFYSYPVWCRWDDPDFRQTATRHAPVCVPPEDLRDRKRAAIQSHRSQLGRVVTDDPSGFILPVGFIEKFVTEDEIFWRMP